MRSMGILTAGLLMGLVVGSVLTTRSSGKQVVTIPDHPVDAADRTVPSPFSVDSQSETIRQVTTAIERVENPGVPLVPVKEIVHFRQAIATLLFIDAADSDELGSLVQQVTALDPDALFARSLNLALYQRWAEIDFDSALDFLLTSLTANGSRTGYRLLEGLEVLAVLRPEAVERRVAALPPGDARYGIESTLHSALAMRNPQQLARQALAAGLAGDPASAEMLSIAVDVWAQQDPRAVIEFLESESSEQQFAMYLNQVMFRWQETDSLAAMSFLSGEIANGNLDLSMDHNVGLFDMYISHMAFSDPRAGYELLQLPSSEPVREMLLDNLLYGWADSNVDDLIDFVTNSDPSLLTQAGGPIARVLSRSDPVSAMQWADSLSGEAHISVRMGVVGEWIQGDPAGVADWLTQLPATQENHGLVSMAVAAMVQRQPDVADELFASLPADHQAQITHTLVFELLQTGEAPARNWVESQSNPQVRQVGNIIIDSLQPGAEVPGVLDSIASLQVDSKILLLSSAMQDVPRSKREEVEQWFSETSLLSPRERELVGSMINPVESGYYSRFEQYPPDWSGMPGYGSPYSLEVR